jgi:hypothetical protein
MTSFVIIAGTELNPACVCAHIAERRGLANAAFMTLQLVDNKEIYLIF